MSSPTVTIVPLNEEDLDPDPVRQFAAWFDHARDFGVHEPEAMAVATATRDGSPSVRMLLLRGHGPDGFVFFTNYESRKAGELDGNPRAALAIHWAPLGRQVRIEGTVTKTSDEEADAYFARRPRGSQLGAWASTQSTPIPGREVLEADVAEIDGRYAGAPVPRPPNWGGFRVMPTAFEFWQHREDRLHDRFLYLPDGKGWSLQRLAP